MKLIMTLLIRNEADIIRQNLEFHRAQGIDEFIVMDHGSTDSTADILRDFVSQGIAEVIPQNDPGYYQSTWVTEMARRAAVALGADWVINSDADEFWWPMEGNLKSTLESTPAGVDVLSVQRHNFAPTLDTEGDFAERMIYRMRTSLNSLGHPLPPKVCHRADPLVEVAQGNHTCRSPGLGRQIASHQIEILHFPVRTPAQITNKIAAGGRAYELSPSISASLGGTWRVLYKELKEKGLTDYFIRECVDSSEPSRMSAEVIVDTRLRDYMRSI